MGKFHVWKQGSNPSFAHSLWITLTHFLLLKSSQTNKFQWNILCKWRRKKTTIFSLLEFSYEKFQSRRFSSAASSSSFLGTIHHKYITHPAGCRRSRAKEKKNTVQFLMSLWFCHYEKRRWATKFQLCQPSWTYKKRIWTQKSPENNHSSRFCRLKQIDFFMRWFVSFLIAQQQRIWKKKRIDFFLWKTVTSGRT